MPIVAVDQRVVRRQLQRPLPGRDPEGGVAALDVHGAERELDVGVRRVERRGAPGGVTIALPGRRPVAPAVDRVLHVAVRQEVPGAGQPGVERHRLQQEVARFGHAGLVVPPVGLLRHQRVVEGFQIRRRAPLRRLDPVEPERPVVAGQGADEPGQHLVAHGEEIVRGPVEALGPDMGAGAGVDELRRDADAARRQLEAALEHMGDAEFAADLAHVGGPVGVDVDGVAGDHSEAVGARQLRDHVLGEGVGETRLPLLAAEVVEGQHGDRQRGGAGARGSTMRQGRTGAAAPTTTAACHRRCRAGVAGLSGQNEPVAPARDGLQHCVGLVPQGEADLAHALHQAVVSHGDARPDRLHHLVLGHHAAGVRGQEAEHGEGLRAQGHRLVRGVAQRLGGEVDPDSVYGDPRSQVHRAPRDHGVQYATTRGSG